MFLVFTLSLLVTLNYYDLWMPLVAKIAPQSTPTVRHTVSLIFMYCLTFGVFLYFCLWLSAERIHVHKAADGIAGVVLGALTGIVCCASLLFIWFSLPFSERMLPVDESTMFFPCHRLAFHGLTFVRNKIPGRREFDGERFLRDLRYGLPQMRELGNGYYVTSVPTGLSVFFQEGGTWGVYSGRGIGARSFYRGLKERMGTPIEDLTPRERKLPFGRKGKTPLFIPSSGASGATIAVMWEELPEAVKERTTGPVDRFLPDGEIAVAETHISDHELYMKVYEVKKQGNIGTLVALFEPDPAKVPKEVLSLRNFMPLRICFPINETRSKEIETDLMAKGVPTDQAQQLIGQLRMCGKAVFTGLGKKRMAIEMTGIGKWRIYEIPTPINLEEPEKKEERPQRPSRRAGTTGPKSQ